ncbi:MAG: DNA translocase FtsK, partial [Clostridia bacterium]|nr:DNA translocase FtsK [Clostridia bacterium]
IKANLPSRIAFKVTNFADANTILGEGGAEKLLGYGDMRYRSPSMPNCERYQGCLVTGKEIDRVVKYIIDNNKAYFNDEVAKLLEDAVRAPEPERPAGGGDSKDGGGSGTETDPMFVDALKHVIESDAASISMLQRRFQIGFSRAGRIIDVMAELGYISSNEGSKSRRVLITKEEFEEKYGGGKDK